MSGPKPKKGRAAASLEWSKHRFAVVSALWQLRSAIDALGEEAVTLTGDERFDQLACYASNTLQGSASLIREMDALMLVREDRRRRGAETGGRP